MSITPNNFITNFTALCIFLFASTACMAASTIDITSDSGLATLLVKNGRLLLKSNDSSNTADIQDITVSEAVFDTDLQTLYLIDHDEQTVTPITKANIEQLARTIGAAADVLDSIPEQHRGGISNFMRGFGIELPETNTSEAVSLKPISEQQFRGITCQENSVIEKEQELGRICITKDNSTPLTDEDYQTLLNAQAFFLLLAKQAQPFAEQYGQSIPNLDGLEISGLLVYSNQTQIEPDSPAASFVVSSIDTSEISEIVLPESYETRTLSF